MIVTGENYTLYLGDCLDIMPTLEAGSIDAVVTDPPYGIGEAAGKNKSRSFLAESKDYGNKGWDNQTADSAVNMAVKLARHSIIFGGNYYDLPPSSCWLIWDKVNGNTDFADCEMAWTNLGKAVRLKRYMWHGMIRDGNDIKVHATQKPLALMEWCISHLPIKTKPILDPFMGSGTTGVAAARTDRKFIGIEKDPEYFEIACERIKNAYGDYTLTSKEKAAGMMPLFNMEANL